MGKDTRKNIKVPAELHKKLLREARRQHRKLPALLEHLIENNHH